MFFTADTSRRGRTCCSSARTAPPPGWCPPRSGPVTRRRRRGPATSGPRRARTGRWRSSRATRRLPRMPCRVDGRSMLYRWDANAPEGQRLSAISPDSARRTRSAGPGGRQRRRHERLLRCHRGSSRRARRRASRTSTCGDRARACASSRHSTRYATPAARRRPVVDPDLAAGMDGRGGRGARVSPNGERLLFASYAQLDPAYDTVEESAEDCGDPEVAGERCRQIYLYDAPSGRISCLTCVAGVAGGRRRQPVRQQRPPPSGRRTTNKVVRASGPPPEPVGRRAASVLRDRQAAGHGGREQRDRRLRVGGQRPRRRGRAAPDLVGAERNRLEVP